MGTEKENTFCPRCGELLIKRGTFDILENRITEDMKCPTCGGKIYVINK